VEVEFDHLGEIAMGAAEDEDLGLLSGLFEAAGQQDGLQGGGVILEGEALGLVHLAGDGDIGMLEVFEDDIELRLVEVGGGALEDEGVDLVEREAGEPEISDEGEVDEAVGLDDDGLVELRGVAVFDGEGVAGLEGVALTGVESGIGLGGMGTRDRASEKKDD
jgi:hypothetical protein